MAWKSAGKETDNIDEDEVVEGDECAEEEHKDEDNDSGIDEFFITFEAFFFGIPWPGGLFEFDLHFGNEFACFGDHEWAG